MGIFFALQKNEIHFAVACASLINVENVLCASLCGRCSMKVISNVKCNIKRMSFCNEH